MLPRKSKNKNIGFNIMRTKNNARKLAHDLAQLQAEVYRQTDICDYIDQLPGEGHLNYELNKFGLALQQKIKDDLRACPEKSLIKFYVNLLTACHEMKNYELAARVYYGIHDAFTRDEYVHVEGERFYELPDEDPAVKRARNIVKTELETLKEWKLVCDIQFPTPAQAKKLFRENIDHQEKFIPLIQACMNFIAIRLDNAKSCYIDSYASPTQKLIRLLEMKGEIFNDLFFIKFIIDKCLPDKEGLYFKDLQQYFADSLVLKLQPPLLAPDTMLDEVLMIKILKEIMSRDVNSVKEVKPASTSSLFAPPPRDASRTPRTNRSATTTPRDVNPSPRSVTSSPRDKIKTPRTPRATILAEVVYVRGIPVAIVEGAPDSPKSRDGDENQQSKELGSKKPLSPKKK